VLGLHVKLVTAVSTASNSVDICNIQLSLITIITIKNNPYTCNTTVDIRMETRCSSLS